MNKETIDRRLSIARDLLHEVEINMEYEFWNSCVNRLYYACFHATRALLLSLDVTDAKTHAGVWSLFNMHVVKTGLIEREWAVFYSTLLDSRSEADYDDFQDFSKEEVESFMTKSQEFIKIIQNIIHENTSQ